MVLQGEADREVMRRLPAPQPVWGTPGYAGDGPEVSEVLYWLYRVKQLVHAAEDLHTGLAQTGAGHQGAELLTLESLRMCGAGARYATDVLSTAVQGAIPEPRPLLRPRLQRAPIDRVAWAHAVCSVRAEIAICAERITTTPDSRRLQDVVELAQQSDRLFQQMAQTGAFDDWCATVDPLYRSWLGGSLSDSAVPPELFPHRTALYQARPELATGWNPADERLSTGDQLPLGSLERYVSDATGERWAIILAAPGGVDDPRDWPAPSGAVVAAQLDSDGSSTGCYLLAEAVAPRQALAVISQSEGGDRLENLAASVASVASVATWRQRAQAVRGW